MRSRQELGAAPLLPNLLHLEIRHHSPVRYEELEWCSMFIGPSLLSFEAHGVSFESRPQTQEEIVSELVTKMSRVCPRLEILRVSCRKDLSLPILDLHNLRVFSINESSIRDELLQALSRLPYLEELSVFQEMFIQPDETDKAPIELSDESFPSLRSLSLDHTSRSLFAQFCASTKLFRGLVSASIYSQFDDNSGPMDNIQHLNTAMFSLGRNSPHITNLTISLEGDSFLPSWPIIDSFKHMPLRYLDLHSVAFDWGEYTAHESGNEEPPVYHPPTGWRDFLAAVPLLEEFILSYQTIDSSTLPIFATMLPHLRLLELDMVIFSGDEEVLSAVGWSPTAQLITLQIGVCEIARESGILNVARYVHHLWPNVTLGTGDWCNPVVVRLDQAIGSLKGEGSQVETNA